MCNKMDMGGVSRADVSYRVDMVDVEKRISNSSSCVSDHPSAAERNCNPLTTRGKNSNNKRPFASLGVGENDHSGEDNTMMQVHTTPKVLVRRRLRRKCRPELLTDRNFGG